MLPDEWHQANSSKYCHALIIGVINSAYRLRSPPSLNEKTSHLSINANCRFPALTVTILLYAQKTLTLQINPKVFIIFVLQRKELSVLHAYSEYIQAITLLPTFNLQKPLNSKLPLQYCVLHTKSTPEPLVPLCNRNQVFAPFQLRNPVFHTKTELDFNKN